MLAGKELSDCSSVSVQVLLGAAIDFHIFISHY